MIRIRGAHANNLQHIDLNIPSNQLVVITGLSGSGKSTLAFDTLFAEGQRRYVESLSVYTRQFLKRVAKPAVDLIEGLSPALAIEQKPMAHNPRSTVGTITEVYDFLRLLYARIGVPHCHRCGMVIVRQSLDQIMDHLFQLPTGSSIMILSPVVNHQIGSHSDALKSLRRQGFARVRIDGQLKNMDGIEALSADQHHTIEVVVDRLTMGAAIHNRLAESLELALSLSQGGVYIEPFGEKQSSLSERLVFNETAVCTRCGVTALELSPAAFSYNSPEGACRRCNGLGYILPSATTDDSASIQVAEKLKKTTRIRQSEAMRAQITAPLTCPECSGSRLRPESCAVTINGMPIYRVAAMPLVKVLDFLLSLELIANRYAIAQPIIKGMLERLNFLCDVGLPYLSLDRPAQTLSGGENQRIRLATQIGAKLSGVLYVMDEPSTGLHPRDINKLLFLLRMLRDLGNTVVVVEHDWDIIRAADHIIDMGPGAGPDGGRVTYQGTPQGLCQASVSLTGHYYCGQMNIPIPGQRRKGSGKSIIITGVSHHNLKSISATFPLGTLICVTGVSGSGKSSLVTDTLYPALANKRKIKRLPCGHFTHIQGLEAVDRVIHIDQSPITGSPRSNPATYTGLFSLIRDLFAKTSDARMKGYTASRFSFNAKGGRCEMCRGEGVTKIDMQFLPDVYITCDICQGRRFNRETLAVRYKGKHIAEVLDMTVAQALAFFKNIPGIKEKLASMIQAGLHYLPLGQSARTLSGGEAQRLNLSRELVKKSTGRTLYILNEPTTGLHIDDIKKLLAILQRLVDGGSTVVIIEHHLDVIKCADYIIDLGPEGGDQGGYVMGCGTPESIAHLEGSHTGHYLYPALFGPGRNNKGASHV